MSFDWLFWLGLALLFTHELDAIRCHEWRLFAVFLRVHDRVSDATAYRVFTVLHVPLFFLFLWYTAQPSRVFQIVVDLFLVVHLGLHLSLRSHPAYEFRGAFSHGIIAAGGLVGALHVWFLI